MYNNVKLQKGLYNLTGKTFLQALEELDPSENYQGTALGELDAYERQLKRFDIKVSGNGCDRVEKFFVTTESAVLFPEFVKRAIASGLEDSILGDIVTVKTNTEMEQYKGITCVDSTTFDSITSQTKNFPETTLQEEATSANLAKYGRHILASYELIRRQKLDIFAVHLRSIGKKLANVICTKAMSTLKIGSANIEIAGTDLTFADLAKFFGSFTAYNMTVMIASPANISKIITLSEIKDSISYDQRGNVILPFGTKLVKSNSLDNNTIIGMDKNYALEFITSSDIIIEADKIIERQVDSITVSCNFMFKKIISDAVKVLDLEVA